MLELRGNNQSQLPPASFGLEDRAVEIVPWRSILLFKSSRVVLVFFGQLLGGYRLESPAAYLGRCALPTNTPIVSQRFCKARGRTEGTLLLELGGTSKRLIQSHSSTRWTSRNLLLSRKRTGRNEARRGPPPPTRKYHSRAWSHSCSLPLYSLSILLALMRLIVMPRCINSFICSTTY